MKSCVVVPTIRPDRIKSFVEAWEPYFHVEGVELIIVEDHDTKELNLPGWIIHVCHEDFGVLGERAGCIATQSGACNAYGVILAAKHEPDMIILLDDDVLPLPDCDLLDGHWQALQTKHHPAWWKVAPFHTRGFPQVGREAMPTMLNHGLWLGMPDLDAPTQMGQPDFRLDGSHIAPASPIPRGYAFPMSGMNVAFRREFAPFMYFLKLPSGMKRWADIWCGLLAKAVADAFSWAVTSGWPCIRHERASNVEANWAEEKDGFEPNEGLWEFLTRFVGLSSGPEAPLSLYRRLSYHLAARLAQQSHNCEGLEGHFRNWISFWE